MFRKVLFSILLLVFFFFVIYPQAFAVGNSSCVIVLGFVGLTFFFINGLFYQKTTELLKKFLPFLICAFLTGVFVDFFDPYIFSYTRSQIAWMFTAYFAVYLFFKLFPKGSLYLFLYFIIGAVIIQCIFSILRYYNPEVDAFCSTYEVKTDLIELKKAQTEGARLIGFGVAYFGAGIVCGVALILISYIIVMKKNNFITIILLSASYVFIFYIGLLSARTTVIGAVISLALLLILLFYSNKTYKSQAYKAIAISILFSIIGYTLCYFYFSDFSDWAFELFTNYETTGELRTNSSDGIRNMFVLPNNIGTWILGDGLMAFWGTDVGYSRLLFYAGIPGTVTFLLYPYFMTLVCRKNINKEFFITLLFLIIFNLVLNIKGLSDLNIYFYLILFYFIFQNYYKQQTYLNYIGRIKANKYNNAIQGTQSRRRI